MCWFGYPIVYWPLGIFSSELHGFAMCSTEKQKAASFFFLLLILKCTDFKYSEVSKFSVNGKTRKKPCLLGNYK